MDTVPDILKTIVEEKRREIATLQQTLKFDSRVMQPGSGSRSFTEAIAARVRRGEAAVIAEIKKASPSKGVIREDFDPVVIARDYEKHGAACLSVLTDRRFFQGSPQYLTAVRESVGLPVLRKDFIIDPLQVHESRAMGADCILLIVAILKPRELRELDELARSLGMDVLVEVHDSGELKTALEIEPRLVGINNRDLRTFDVDLETTIRLLDQIPDDTLVVTESGIRNVPDIERMKGKGVCGFLVGEAMMRHESPGEKLSDLFGCRGDFEE